MSKERYQFRCPQCRRPVAVDFSAIGRRCRCPHCQAAIIVPGGAPAGQQKAAASGPSRDEWLDKGQAFVQQRDYPNAIAAYTKAIELAPSLPEGYNNRGNVYALMKDYDRAIADFDAGIRYGPDVAELYYHRAYARQGKGDYEAAIGDCDRAIELAPDLAPAYYSRAVARHFRQQYDGAWADVRQAQGKGFEVSPEFLAELQKASGTSGPAAGAVAPQPPGQANPGVCWFCEKNPPDEESAVKVEMYKDGGLQTQTVKVPRCKLCCGEHNEGVIIFTSAVLGLILGVILFWKVRFLVGVAGTAAAVTVGTVVDLKQRRKRKEQLAGVKVKAEDAAKWGAPQVELLRAQGWVLEKGGSTAWHAQAKAPDKLFAEEAPNKCPACGANTNPLIRVEASNFAVRCHFCGAWGCRNCAHFHDENKKATNKAIQRPLLGGPKVYAGAPWIHNQCCKCGFKLGLLQKFS